MSKRCSESVAARRKAFKALQKKLQAEIEARRRALYRQHWTFEEMAAAAGRWAAAGLRDPQHVDRVLRRIRRDRDETEAGDT